MATVVGHKGQTSTVAPTGTASHLVVGPPRNARLFGGNVEGLYIKQDATNFRWIEDQPRASRAGARRDFAYFR